MRRIVTVSVVALLLVGCGPKRAKTGVVTGTVTYNSKPVNDAALMLYLASAGPDAAPITIPVTHEGEFRISDVPAGEYKIVVQGSAGATQVPPALFAKMPKEKQAEMKAKLDSMNTPATIPFPNKYKELRTTNLKCTINESDQKMDLPLSD
jgi:hypothetical protein